MRFRPAKEKVVLVEDIYGREMKAETGGVMAMSAAKDRFYDKLGKLNESSGLSILFDFRQTSLDLYKLYQEVTVRGGYHQVTKEKKWGEVASIINGSILLPDQLQKIYENLLFPFEQIYHYRTSTKDHPKVDSTSGNTSSFEDCLSCLDRKRKRNNNSIVSIQCDGSEQLASEKRKLHKANKSNKSTGQRCIKETTLKDKDIEIKIQAPLRPRSAYQIFLMKECERLKRIHGEKSEGINTRNMAIEAWRELSAEIRKPYIEESEKDKERFNRETKIHNEEKHIPALKLQKKPWCEENSKKSAINCTKMMWSNSNSDYHVTLEPAPENINVPNESDIELALKLMKNKRVNDMVFQTNLEEFWSVDFPC